MVIVALALFAYLFGTVPYGLLIAKAKGVDIMKVGSGNIGATNVTRALGPTLGLIAFALDVMKGWVPGLVTKGVIKENTFGLEPTTWAFVFCVVAILGHMFSPWLKFKGGKGIATGLGATLGAIPAAGLTSFGVMILVTAITRYVSLGSLVATVAIIPISLFVYKDTPQVVPILLLMGAFIFYKHKANIQRLKLGTESKFSFKKTEGLAKPEEQTESDQRP
jgi:glycerol-3-phosphate acyltransferase PlsY